MRQILANLWNDPRYFILVVRSVVMGLGGLAVAGNSFVLAYVDKDAGACLMALATLLPAGNYAATKSADSNQP